MSARRARPLSAALLVGVGLLATTGTLLVVSNDDGSASLASATPSKIALIRTSTDTGGVRLDLYVVNADGSGSWTLLAARPSSPDGQKIVFERRNPRHDTVATPDSP